MSSVFIRIKNFSGKVGFAEEISFGLVGFLGAGATISMAEEMAARDALRRLFETDEKRAPIPFDRLFKKGLLIEKQSK